MLVAVGGLAVVGVHRAEDATLLGSGIWSWLIARRTAGAVAPFSMLVPVGG